MDPVILTSRTKSLKRIRIYAFFAILGLVIGLLPQTAPVAQATIPKHINFQGKLTAVSGGANVADGVYSMRFKLYDALSGGSLLWTETFDNASSSDPCYKRTVTNGVFNAKLGACASLASIDFTGGALYLSVDVNITGSYDGEMSPRKQLVSSPFAFIANGVSGDGNIDLADFDVDSDGKTVIAPDTTGDALTITTAAADIQGIVIDASTADSTQTAGIIQITADTVTDTAVLGLALTGNVRDAAGNLSVYGNKTTLTVDTDAVQSHTAYGQHVTIANNDASSTAYGLYVDAGTGAGTEYAAAFQNGNVGIGTLTPTSPLHIAKTNSTADISYTGQTIAITDSGTHVGGDENRQGLSSSITTSGNFTSAGGRILSIQGGKTSATYSGTVSTGGDGNELRVVGTEANATFSGTMSAAGDLVNAYGVYANSNGDIGTTGTTSHFGGYFTTSGTADTNYGIYANVSGATTNYAAVFTGGNVGIGDATPSAQLEVGDGTDSLQVSSVGDLTFVDANGAASITGPAGGALTVTGGSGQVLTLDSGTTGGVNLGIGNNAKTIAIGTGTAGNVINIGTNNTISDTVTIGSVLDNVAITGDQWSITDAGVLTVASCTGCGGGGGALDTLTAATTDDSALLNADNTIIWEWALTSAASKGMTLGESAAGTGGSGNQHLLQLTTDATSTAGALEIVSNSADSGDIEFNLNSDGDFEIQDAGTAFATFDGAGGITFASTAGSDFIINQAAGTNVQITATAVPTVDMLAISNSGQVVTADTVDGLFIDFRTGNGTDPTNSGINLDLVSGGTASTDILNGIDISLTSTAGGTDRGINIGSGFDTALNIVNAATAQGIVIDAASTDTTNTNGIIQVTADTLTNNAILGYSLTGNIRDAASGLTVYGNKTLLTVDTDAGSSHTAYGNHITIDNDDATSTAYGQYIDGGSSIGISTALGLTNNISTYGATAVAGVLGAYTLTNTTTDTQFQFGNRYINTISSASGIDSTYVGDFIRMIDNDCSATDCINTVRGLEVQAWSGTNNAGTNTGIASFGKTFGVQATTSGQASSVSQAAALFADLDNGSNATLGNAIRAYTDNATSANLVSIYQETTAYTGTGLVMNFANNSGTFASGNFADFQKAGTTYFKVDSDGNAFATLNSANSAALCWDGTGGTAEEITDCTGGPSADYAEMYPVAEDVEAGEVVVVGEEQIETYDQVNGNVDWALVKGKINQLVKSNSGYQPTIVGIVSDNYNDFSSTGYNIKEEDNPKSIALAGRVLVKVSTENGDILPGDYLTSSETQPGFAMKATKPGMVIGQALAPFNTQSETNSVMVFVNTHYWIPSVGVLLQDSTETLLSAQTMQDLNMLDASAFDKLVVADTLYVAKKLVVGERIETVDLVANTITAKEKLCIGNTCVTESQLQAVLQLIEQGSLPQGNPAPPPPEEEPPPSDEDGE